MEIIYLLIPLSMVVLGLACWAFFWAVKADQFGDLDSPARQILQAEEVIEPKPERTKE